MPIIDINPIKSIEAPRRITPIYLVSVEDTTVKLGHRKFVAVKLDELSNMIKIVGFETNIATNKIEEKYQDLINDTDKRLYKELMLPMQRIFSIQNLIFKQK